MIEKVVAEVVVTVVLFALLNVKEILNNQAVAVPDLLVLPNVLRSAKDILDNQVAAVLVLHVLFNVLMLVRLRLRKVVLTVQHNVAETATMNVHMVVGDSATHHVEVSVKESAVEVARWNVHHMQRILHVPHVVEHVGVHVMKIVHTTVIQRVRV